jgi:Zinc knuckle
LTAGQKQVVTKEAQDQYLAVAFVLSADRNRFGKLVEDMENDYLQGRDNFPKSLTAAYNLLTNWKQDPRYAMRYIGPANDGVSFTNVDGAGQDEDVALLNTGKKGTDKQKGNTRDKSHITCHKCNEQGHYANECPSQDRQSAAQMLMSGVESGAFDDEK